ncbi:MAG: methyltransferase [Candidatus Aenigmarchaeota archaeon]|nr:methyltransferase [Candidatus Aenigmarchaeota archaeon]
MKVSEIKFFSEKTRKFYKLVKTSTWPTVKVSGIFMHRVKDVDPKTDSILKVKALGKIEGIGLDTCTGLGYTSILSAREKNVKKIVTIEEDDNLIRIAKLNPCSKELFTNPKIELVIGDTYEQIRRFPDEYFNFIIHDPPRISIAGELYSLEFYKQLFRVLKKGGKLFHYIGEPGKRQRKNYSKGILQRLRLAGLKRIERVDYAKGVVCLK